MNNNRRKEIQEMVDRLKDIQATLEELESDERDAFDNLPEGFQSSERGEAMEQAADMLNEAACGIDDIVSALEESQS